MSLSQKQQAFMKTITTIINQMQSQYHDMVEDVTCQCCMITCFPFVLTYEVFRWCVIEAYCATKEATIFESKTTFMSTITTINQSNAITISRYRRYNTP